MRTDLRTSRWFGWVYAIRDLVRQSGMLRSPRRQRPPELSELEARFNKDVAIDPEQVRNRQVAASIRSGRG